MELSSLLTYALIQCGFSKRGRKGLDHRLFLSALIYLGKTGCWWKNLPPQFGNHKSIYSRFKFWSNRRVFDVLFELISQSDDKTILRFMDSAFVKCSITSTTGRWVDAPRVIGRSKGGFTTKITAICDVKKRVYQCRIDPGQASDHRIAKEMKFTAKSKVIVADKGYSSKDLRERIERQGSRHCIAKKSNEYDKFSFNRRYYQRRHCIENVFSNLRRWTRLELRRERIAQHFQSFVMLFCLSTWVKF